MGLGFENLQDPDLGLSLGVKTNGLSHCEGPFIDEDGDRKENSISM